MIASAYVALPHAFLSLYHSPVLNLPLDHIGIAVSDLDSAIAEYASRFGAKLEFRERVPDQGVEVAFLFTGESKIELLVAIDDSSTFAKSVSLRGYGLHHIAFKVTNIEAELRRLADAGCKLIDTKPRKGAHGKRIAFIHPRSTGGVLTELVEHPPP